MAEVLAKTTFSSVIHNNEVCDEIVKWGNANFLVAGADVAHGQVHQVAHDGGVGDAGGGRAHHRLGFVEIFGTGIMRIRQLYEKSLRKPEFEVSENAIQIVVPVW